MYVHILSIYHKHEFNKMEVQIKEEEQPLNDFCQENVEINSENVFVMAHTISKKDVNLEAEISNSAPPLNIKSEPEHQSHTDRSTVSTRNLNGVKTENLMVETSDCVIHNTDIQSVKHEPNEKCDLPNIKNEIEIEYMDLQPCSSKQSEKHNKLLKDVTVNDMQDVKPFKYEGLNEECDLPGIESEIDHPEYVYSHFQPRRSKQIQTPLKSVVNKFKKKKRQYECPVCTRNFPSSSKRNKHFNTHFDGSSSSSDKIKKRKQSQFGKYLTVCRFCGKLYTRREEFLLHVLRYRMNNIELRFLGKKMTQTSADEICLKEHPLNAADKTPCPCKICLKLFVPKNNIAIHPDEKLFKCEICLKLFKNKSGLRVHTFIHTGKPFECEVCVRQFSKKRDLTEHMFAHTGEKPYKCEICSNRYTYRRSLKDHMVIHTGTPFECEIRSKKIVRKSRKINTDSGEGPFECEICPRQFTKKQDLEEHTFGHTSQKPFKCAICSNRYAYKRSLNVHMLVHTGTPFECKICSKQFLRKSYVINHMNIHTGERPFRCDICSKDYTSKRNLNYHLQTHYAAKAHKCEVCSKEFLRKAVFLRHQATHNSGKHREKPFKCKICPKQFTQKTHLKQHIMGHTGEKPHKCEVCLRTFARKSTLSRHTSVHAS